SLASELADGALSFARAHRYTVVDRPRVDLLADPKIERADIRVVARFAAPDGAARCAARDRPRRAGPRRGGPARRPDHRPGDRQRPDRHGRPGLAPPW